MAAQTQEELLLFLLIPYINRELNIELTTNDLVVKYIENDQNSKLAFHLFSNDLYNSFNIRVYAQYTPNTSFSEFYFESINKESVEPTLTLDVGGTDITFYLNNSSVINLVLSMTVGDEFFNLPPGNILPIDYQILNVVNSEEENYNILTLDNLDPLIANGNALLIKGVS